MSDSESDLDLGGSDSESEGYASASPPPKKKAAPKAKPAAAVSKPKAAPKPKADKPAASKPKAKQPLKQKASPNGTRSDDDSDAMSGVSDFDGKSNSAPTPGAKGLGKDIKELGGQAGKGKNASEMYQKLSQIEHILKRPDSYIGSVQSLTQMMWVFDDTTKKMVYRNVTFVPGFFKIFDEILVNAADNKINDPSMDQFKITIDRKTNVISVYNNGRGIPIQMHQKENMYIPELIFGNLLTSSNYDDDEKKLTGGRNGFGAKLTNIYSLTFTVETADKDSGLKYVQTFSENMSKKSKPKITQNPKGEEYTKITFEPDLARFGMDTIDDDTASLLMKRAYDMAGTVRGVKVWLDGTRLKVNGFKQYVEMYLSSAADAAADAGAEIPKTSVIFEQISERWEVAFALAPEGQFQQVSFVNSISTIKGGTHVEAVASQLSDKLLEPIKKKNKAAPVKAHQIKNHMWIFVNALIENPAFDSQTKETLNTKKSMFGSKFNLSEEFVKKVTKSGIIDNILSWAKFKQDKDMKKTDGGKKARISGIVKLEDANKAGTKDGKHCTLILTEGDSAKALAVAGLDIVGRDHYGVFPLRGKLLNVREASGEQLMKNTEIQYIKQIMGLKQGTVYHSVDGLRYGSLMIMTDQDQDGSHIKGLLINFLDHFFPSLLKIPGFLVEFITPIVKATKAKVEKSFYTLPEYETWREENNDGKGWHIKYFKGLGTSTSADAKKYFSDMAKHMLQFDITKEGDRDLIDLAFNKKKADDRKEWLRQFRPGTFLDQSIKVIPYSDFINKELILFSMADNVRSIPSVVDGLKPGQRKVIYGCYLKKLKGEIKVAQLAGFVSEKTAYHHGEVSLTGTIVGLAQDFVGSNNINLLVPAGQYGTRNEGGKDHAAARYIFTDIPSINRAVFHPSDDPLLNYLTDDNDKIEPSWYIPVLPMVLVNGADGIGTGWSTSIPNYNPTDIVDNLRRLMKGEEMVKMDPWFRGYGGTITRIADDKFSVSGTLEKIDDETIEVTELPIRKWTTDYKAMLDGWVTGTDKIPASIKAFDEHHVGQKIKFRIEMTAAQMRSAEEEGLEKRFKIHTTVSTTNMVAFDPDGKIKKYASPEEMILEFYDIRVTHYVRRKENLTNDLTDQFEKLSNQARFVTMIIKKELVVSNRKKAAIVDDLRKLNFRPFPKSKVAKLAGEDEDALEEAEEGLQSDYDYLLGMAIWSLTEEKVNKLLKEQADKEHELNELLKLSPTDLWNTDLDRFLEEWESVLENDAKVQASGKAMANKGKAKSIAAKAMSKAKKGKAAAGSDDDDSEDDFQVSKPKKAAPVKKAPAPIVKKEVAKKEPAPVPSIMDVDSDEDVKKPVVKKKALPGASAAAKKPTPTKRKVSAKKKQDSSDEESAEESEEDDYDDFDNISPEKPAKIAKTSKAKAKVESDDDEDESDAAPVKKAPVKKAKAVLSDDDSDAAPVKPKAAPKPKPKAKAPASDDDDDSDAAPKKKVASKGKAKAAVDSDDEMEEAKPKSKLASKAASTTKLAPIFTKTASASSSKPAATPAKKPVVKKPKKDESEDDFDVDSLMDDDDAPPAAPVAPRSKRAAAPKKAAAYIDIGSDSE